MALQNYFSNIGCANFESQLAILNLSELITFKREKGA